MKKIISLGGNYFQMTAVKAAIELGIYVIDVDYLPQNPAHRYADEYHNISTLDMDAVLKLAKEKMVDGIISYASDVSAPTAAYVAEKLGLPGNPFETVEIMCRKDKFHPFLKEHGHYMPRNQVVDDLVQLQAFYRKSSGSIMVKPTHSSGSKGISNVTDEKDLEKSFFEAKRYLHTGDVIIAEEYLERDYYQIAGDAFVQDGEIIYFGLANEHFDIECNPLVPIGESFPADITSEKRSIAKREIQRALNNLGYLNGAVNLDFMFDKKGNVFIIELGPRNGGNLITDAILLGGGPDLAKATVLNAIGEKVSLDDNPVPTYVSSFIWHSLKNGVYESKN